MKLARGMVLTSRCCERVWVCLCACVVAGIRAWRMRASYGTGKRKEKIEVDEVECGVGVKSGSGCGSSSPVSRAFASQASRACGSIGHDAGVDESEVDVMVPEACLADQSSVSRISY